MKTIVSLLITIAMIYGTFNSLYAQDDTQKKCSHTDIQVKEIDAQKALVIRAEVPSNAIGGKIGELYSALYVYLQTQKIAPAGAPFAIYYSFDPNGNTVFEAGVPVAEQTPGKDNITYKEFPVTKVVTTLFYGSYADMGAAYTDIQKYMTDNKLEPTGATWEVYLTDPESVSDPSQNQTIIYFPVK
jgi:effector-binding domain-containing protein